MPDFDVYQELGVERDASTAAIRAAFRRLAKEHHPDVAANKEAADERMKRLNRAWDTLADAATRAEFDQGWFGPTQSPHRRPGGTKRSGESSSSARRKEETAQARKEQARARAEQVRREREAKQREADRRAREAAEAKQRREREEAARRARERRARATAEREARKRRAGQLREALLADDVALLTQIDRDGVVDWGIQRPSVRFQAARAVDRVTANRALDGAVSESDDAEIARLRRRAWAIGADAPAHLRSITRQSLRTKPTYSPYSPRSRTARPVSEQGSPGDAPPPRPPVDDFDTANSAFQASYGAGAWGDAARAWMAMRARWPERVTNELAAKGRYAAQQWGDDLGGGTDL